MRRLHQMQGEVRTIAIVGTGNGSPNGGGRFILFIT